MIDRQSDQQDEVPAAVPAGAAMETAEKEVDPSLIRAGLVRIRKRRWMLWSLFIVYLPAMSITQKITGSFNDSLPVFFLWFLLILLTMGYSAVARCPRCGNYFHLNGITLLYLRKCLHCQLHLSADSGKHGDRGGVC